MEIWLSVVAVTTMALALALQVPILAALYLEFRRQSRRIQSVAGRFQVSAIPMLARTSVLVENVSPRICEVVSRSAQVTRLARMQVEHADHVVNEAIESLRSQIARTDRAATDTLEGIAESGSRFRRKVSQTVCSAAALKHGVQKAIEVYRNGNHKRGEFHLGSQSWPQHPRPLQ